MTFDDAVEQFAVWLLTARGRSRATAENYQRDLRQFAEFAAVDLLKNLDRPAVMRWLGELKARHMSPRSRARKLSALRSFVSWALEYHLLEADPIPGEVTPPKSLYLPHALTETEVQAILSAVAAQDDSPVSTRRAQLLRASTIRDHAILEVLYASGMRVSELCGLKLIELHLGEGFAMVTGKGSKQRLVPLGHYAMESLQTYFAQRAVICRTAHQHGEVFLSQRGPISRSQVFRIIKVCAARAEVKGKVSPHTLRHSCASHLLAHGADLRLVQELLGHSALSTTQVYTHIEKSRLRKVYDACHPMA